MKGKKGKIEEQKERSNGSPYISKLLYRDTLLCVTEKKAVLGTLMPDLTLLSPDDGATDLDLSALGFVELLVSA